MAVHEVELVSGLAAARSTTTDGEGRYRFEGLEPGEYTVRGSRARDLVAGLNYGKGSGRGGNFRNDGGRPNGISEYVDNSADGVEAFVVDNRRVSDRLMVVLGSHYVTAARDVRTTNAETGAVSNPKDRYASVNPRLGVIAALNDRGVIHGNVSRLFEAPTTFEVEDDLRGGMPHSIP